jgi:hypothetical protein
MGREFHVRFRESPGVQFPRATRLVSVPPEREYPWPRPACRDPSGGGTVSGLSYGRQEVPDWRMRRRMRALAGGVEIAEMPCFPGSAWGSG